MPSRDDFEQEDEPRRKPRASREDESITPRRPGSGGPRRPRRDQPEEDAPPPPRKSNKTLLIVLLGLGGFALMTLCICCGVGGYFGYEFQQAASDAKRTSNDLKEIGLAMHNYHDVYNYFPPYITAKNGKPLLSWRVALLLFVGQDNLFKQFKLDESWDGPNNRKLLDRCPPIYLSRRHKDPSLTCYQGYMGKDTLFDPHRQHSRRALQHDLRG
jgi:uncharacterized protein DUF1559